MKETIEYQNIRENKKYKDTLFRMVFKNKKDYSCNWRMHRKGDFAWYSDKTKKWGAGSGTINI